MYCVKLYFEHIFQINCNMLLADILSFLVLTILSACVSGIVFWPDVVCVGAVQTAEIWQEKRCSRNFGNVSFSVAIVI